MSSYDEILAQVPVSQLAQQLGVDESEVSEAAESALPALLGGLRANAEDPAGASSLMAALGQHQQEAADVQDIDVVDGEKIVGNIFGDQTDQVKSRLGGLGGGSTGSLVQKLLPILAPIVLSWLAKKMGGSGGLGGRPSGGTTTGTQIDDGPLFPGGQGAQSTPTQSPTGTEPQPSSGSNPIQDILGSVLGGGSSSGSAGGAGDILGGILGGLLGSGKR